MSLHVLVLAFIALYQLLRALLLTLAVLTGITIAGAAEFSGLVLALAAGAFVPAALLVQLILTRQSVLVPPLRLGVLLQLFGSFLLLLRAPSPDAILISRPATVFAAAGALVILDAISLLFLLLCGKMQTAPSVSPPSASADSRKE